HTRFSRDWSSDVCSSDLDHPDDGKPVTLHEGRYGPYVKHGKVNATLPKDIAPDQVTLNEALSLIAARAARIGGKPARGRKTAAKIGRASCRGRAETGRSH